MGNLEDTMWAEVILDKLAAAGLMDIGVHFLPWCKLKLKDRCMWRMQQNGQEVWSRTDCILVTYHRLFQDVAVRYTRHQSEHYMVLVYLRGELANDLTGYLCKER